MSRSADRLPLASSWYEFRDDGPGVVRIWEPHVHELLQANAFLVRGVEEDLLIDSCLGVVSLRTALEDAGMIERPVIAVATHAHYDHIGSIHEFDQRLIHAAEAEDMATAADDGTLRSAEFPVEFLEACRRAGMPLPELLISAAPYPGFDPDSYSLKPAAPTGEVREGDILDLGERQLRVLHLPGHSPGGIGLIDEANDVLFAGDAIYDGPLLDEALPGADVTTYLATMKRIKALSPERIHGGHNGSFGRSVLERLIDEYVVRRSPAH